MAIMYGKIRIYATAGTSINVTSALGATKAVIVPTGATYIDVFLAGLEEYTVTDGTASKTVLLNYNGFVEVTL